MRSRCLIRDAARAPGSIRCPRSRTKLKLAHAGLPTPAWSEDGERISTQTRRVIVKPVWEHGSLGLDELRCMRGADAARAIAERNLRWKTEHFAESFLDGREFNLSLLDGPSGPRVLPIAEIVFEGFAGRAPRIVGYDAKWTPDSDGLYRHAAPLRS